MRPISRDATPQKERNVPGLKYGIAPFYNALYEPRGMEVQPHVMPIISALEDKRIKQLMVIIAPGSGKSTVISQAYPLWELGQDPSKSILIISGGDDLASGFQNAASETIEYSEVWKALFPDVQPDKKRGWSETSGIFVTGRPGGNPDPSIGSYGYLSRSLTGKHGQILIVDDIMNKENSATEEQRKKLLEDGWIKTVMGRQDPRGARLIVTGRRWATDDIYGTLEKDGQFVVLTLPAERPKSRMLWFDVKIPKMPDGSPMPCVFSEENTPDEFQDPKWNYIKYKVFYGMDLMNQGFFWPNSAHKRTEYFNAKRLSPSVTASVYGCDPSVQGDPIFLNEDMVKFRDISSAEAKKGRASFEVNAFIDRMNGRVVQAWDTAAGKSRDSAYSVCTTALLVPSQSWDREVDRRITGLECERHNKVYILDMMRRKIDFGELQKEFLNQNLKWRPDAIIVEAKSTGDSLISLFKGSMPIQPAHVGREGKSARVVNSISGKHGSVQGWFRLQRVKLLEDAEWVETMVNELLEFTGSDNKYSDIVDSLAHLIRYGIANGSGLARLPSVTNNGETNEFGQNPMAEPSERATQLQAIGALGEQAKTLMDELHPLNGLCGHCIHWAGRPVGQPPISWPDPSNAQLRVFRQSVENKCLKMNVASSMFGSCGGYEFYQEANEGFLGY